MASISMKRAAEILTELGHPMQTDSVKHLLRRHNVPVVKEGYNSLRVEEEDVRELYNSGKLRGPGAPPKQQDASGRLRVPRQ